MRYMIGSVREYAEAKGKSYRKVYQDLENGVFNDPGAEVTYEQKKIYRIKWED